MAGRYDELDALMAEQLDYYRARAAEFDAERRHAESDPGLVAEVAALEQALHRVGPSGTVLKLGCGRGNWTERLAEWADRLVAVDAAPEMIDCARAKVEANHVEFVVADLFAWSPPSRFDVVLFAFLLSHVPPSRFDAFWELVGQASPRRGGSSSSTTAPARRSTRNRCPIRTYGWSVGGCATVSNTESSRLCTNPRNCVTSCNSAAGTQPFNPPATGSTGPSPTATRRPQIERCRLAQPQVNTWSLRAKPEVQDLLAG